MLLSALDLDRPQSAEPDLMMVVLDGETPRLAAVRRDPYCLVLSEGDPGAIPVLVEAIAAADHALPGVNGPALLAQRFALDWSLSAGTTSAPHFSITLLKQSELMPPLPAEGGLRLAGAADRDLVADWAEAFARAVGLSQAEIDGARQQAIARLAEKTLYLWQVEDRPVCLSGYRVTDPNKRAGRINMVYTPPDDRRRGYAGACVSRLSHSLLLAGWDYCLIFADDANATASALYRRIGFEPIGHHGEHLFTA